MIHSSYFRPKVMPVLADLNPVEIDRLQDLSGSGTLNRTKIEEIGRDGLVDWKKSIPSINLTLRQLEYGSMEFFRKIANKSDAVTQINFTDFKTPKSDIACYKTDDNGTFLGTIWYPGTRVSGFSINIGDPEALVERNFTLVGEDEIMLQEGGKYLIHKRFAASGGLNETFTVDDPVPAADPDNSGQFLFKVVRVRSGSATELTHGTDWSYDGTDTLTINGTSLAGDAIKVWYSAASYISGETPFTVNDADLAGVSADSCDIFLVTSDRVARLQSASLEVSLDRYDVKEIGNKNTVAYGTRDISTRVSLGKIVEDYSIEEILRGQAGTTYSKIDVREFSSDLSLVIKVYEDNTKETFKMGYKCTDLAPVGTELGTPTSDYVNRSATLEGEEGFITTVEGVL